jgi:phenylalanine-4-hydroxylase
MLMHPAIADFMKAYGEAGLKAHTRGLLPLLSRVYWYSIEFGLVSEPGGLRLYGAGMASSFSEARFCLESCSPHRLEFDLARVMRTHYFIDDFQACYFALRDLDALLELSHIDFSPYYALAGEQPTCSPSELQAEDIVIARGDQSYLKSALG